ncbi:MAG: ABC transporter transmembrane domain-containing protein [Oscillospiraceae bacterium]
MHKKNKIVMPKQQKSGEGSIGKLLVYCRKYLPAVIIAMVAAVGGTILSIVGPGKLSAMTDAIMAGLSGVMDLNLVFSIAIILVFFYAASALLNFLQSWIMATVTQRVSQNMRTDISQKINRLPLKYFDKVSHGDVLSRVTNDVDTIGQSMNQSIPSLITAITMFIGSLLMMFVTNWIMALTAVFFNCYWLRVNDTCYFKIAKTLYRPARRTG